MKRDITFDNYHRDLKSVREQARIRKIGVGIGACGLGACSNDGEAPTCDSYDLASLDRDFAVTSMSTRALAGQNTATITMNPLDNFFCPVAISMVVSDSTDPGLARRGWVLDARIRGCLQFDWENATNTVAAATNWIDSSQWDPSQRSGCACPVNMGCFTNQGSRQALLTFTIGNPHPVGINIDVIIYMWGVGYNCCPGFITGGEREMIKPRTPGQPAKAPVPAPAGRAPVFAR